LDGGAIRQDGARGLVRWWSSWDGLSAVLALALGTLTVAAFIGSSPGYARLELALILGPLWALFGLIWLGAMAFSSGRRRSPFRRLWLLTPVIVGVAFALTVAGVVLSNDLRTPTATMDIEASVTGTRAEIRGTTDVPEGSRISVGARHDNFLRISTYTETRVHGGGYVAVLNLDRWPRGPVTISAAFSVDGSQPSEAIERFGIDGERLWGPDVSHDSDGPVLSASVTVDLRDGLAADDPQALKAPATLAGSVIDSNGELIDSASVECVFPVDRSKELWEFAHGDGGLYMCTSQPGSWELRATAPGFLPANVQVNLSPGEERDLDIALEALDR
jgi:hypothetical protein